MRDSSLNHIRKIVVRLPNWLGDAVMSVPALRSLRRAFPDAHITLVARPGIGDLFIDNDFVDEILTYDRSGLASVGQQIKEWRRRRFDLAVLFQNAFEAAAIAFLARVPFRIGYDTERRARLLTRSIALPEWKDERHESFYYLNLISELERQAVGRSQVEEPLANSRLEIPKERQKKAREILRQNGARKGVGLFLLCPGSINSRAKRWPAEYFAELVDLISHSDADAALIGSAGELDVSERICQLSKHRPILLTGKTTVVELASIISLSDVLITNDTGPAHLGAAVETPTLVIFGPTNPLTTYPLSKRAEIIRHPPDCAPCMLRDCPIDHRCMTEIKPAEVFERANKLIVHQRIEASA